MRPGPTNSLTDVPGIRVGHATRTERGWLTGTTVVLAPDAGAVGGVDVRGGAPGTRETDLLDPRNLVDRVNAVVLTGGSAFGLAAADGVVQRLYAAGLGWPMGEPGQVVPIVPGAVLFDLGRGGEFGHAPGPADGAAAYDAARAAARARRSQGCVGAGTGAKVGGLKGGIGSASAVLDDGTTVAALVAVNALGSVLDERVGELFATASGSTASSTRSACRPRPSWRRPTQGLRRHTKGNRSGRHGHDDRCHRDRCHPHQGAVPEGERARARRPRTGRPPGAHAARRRHALHPRDGGAAGARAAWAARPHGRGRGLRHAGGAHAVLAATSVANGAVDLRSYRDAFPSAVRMGR